MFSMRHEQEPNGMPLHAALIAAGAILFAVGVDVDAQQQNEPRVRTEVVACANAALAEHSKLDGETMPAICGPGAARVVFNPNYINGRPSYDVPPVPSLRAIVANEQAIVPADSTLWDRYSWVGADVGEGVGLGSMWIGLALCLAIKVGKERTALLQTKQVGLVLPVTPRPMRPPFFTEPTRKTTPNA